jgi:PhzF family phenazine biosynthesis protein
MGGSTMSGGGTQRIFHINAFAAAPFAGNPAIVCPLDRWTDDSVMQRIAAESRLTCAFFVGGNHRYRLRWFTPGAEIDGICGHGTLAAGCIALNELGETVEEVVFDVPAGELRVRRQQDRYILDLPALVPHPRPVPDALARIVGRDPDAVVGELDLICVLPDATDVAAFVADMGAIAALPLRAFIITAPGQEVDFVSRWFGPKVGGGEDTGITGSAHCSLVPYWATRLGKTKLRATQLSPRGGTIDCDLANGRVRLLCTAVKYMEGWLYL